MQRPLLHWKVDTGQEEGAISSLQPRSSPPSQQSSWPSHRHSGRMQLVVRSHCTRPALQLTAGQPTSSLASGQSGTPLQAAVWGRQGPARHCMLGAGQGQPASSLQSPHPSRPSHLSPASTQRPVLQR